MYHHLKVLSIRHPRLQLAIKENYGFTLFNVKMHCRDSLFVVNNKMFAKFRGLLMPHQLFSPSFQRVTLFLPLGGSWRELLRGAVSIQTSLSLSLLPGQVALLIAGSEWKRTCTKSLGCVQECYLRAELLEYIIFFTFENFEFLFLMMLSMFNLLSVKDLQQSWIVFITTSI